MSSKAKKSVIAMIKNPDPVPAGKKVTNRGFRIDEFEDCYGNKCSLQKSSSAMQDCVWLGVDDAKPQIMASVAAKMGLWDLLTPGEPIVGWVPFPLPDDVLLTTRMHLTREQVKALLPALKHFVKTGELP